MTKKRRIKRLTKEQQKIAWSEPESNAGAGWTSKYGKPSDPHEFEEGQPIDNFDPWKDALK